MSATCAGITQWCMIGKHSNCAHRVGGSQESGVWMPEYDHGTRTVTGCDCTALTLVEVAADA